MVVACWTIACCRAVSSWRTRVLIGGLHSCTFGEGWGPCAYELKSRTQASLFDTYITIKTPRPTFQLTLTRVGPPLGKAFFCGLRMRRRKICQKWGEKIQSGLPPPFPGRPMNFSVKQNYYNYLAFPLPTMRFLCFIQMPSFLAYPEPVLLSCPWKNSPFLVFFSRLSC